MLQECVDVFSRQLREKSERWLLDHYVPKDGTYVLIDMDNNFELAKVLNIKTDKKTGTVQGDTDLDYSLISFLDYYSKLIEMNKPVDPAKTIHSNNLYSFFVKKDSLQEKLTDQIIDGYYAVLRNPYQKYSKAKDQALYKQVEQELGPVDTGQLDRIAQWVKENCRSLTENEAIDVSGKDYLKLFFIGADRQQSQERVRREGRRYLLPNIFNKNDYNRECADGIWGLPGNNMGLNAKKPFLANRSRKVPVPYMLSLDRALLQSQFFDYLAGQASKGKNNIYVDLDRNEILSTRSGEAPVSLETGIYLRIRPGKELEIQNVSRITGYRSALSRPFEMKEVLKIPDKAMAAFEPGYGTKTRLYELETLVDDVFFSKRLKYNYFTKPKDLSFYDSAQKNMLLMFRERFWAWFYQGETNGILPVLDRLLHPLLVESIGNTSIKPKHQMNLWISLVDYLNNDRRAEKTMEDVRAALRAHMDSREEWMFDNDNEYYYAVGQLLNTLIGLNKSLKKPLSLANPVLNAKSDRIVKDRLMVLFKKYNYAIEMTDVRIRALHGHIMRYEPQSGAVDSYMVSAGFVDMNLVYMKKDSAANERTQADEA